MESGKGNGNWKGPSQTQPYMNDPFTTSLMASLCLPEHWFLSWLMRPLGTWAWGVPVVREVFLIVSQGLLATDLSSGA